MRKEKAELECGHKMLLTPGEQFRVNKGERNVMCGTCFQRTAVKQ